VATVPSARDYGVILVVSVIGMLRQLTNDSELIALAFIRAHVAAEGVLRVWTRLTALISL